VQTPTMLVYKQVVEGKGPFPAGDSQVRTSISNLEILFPELQTPKPELGKGPLPVGRHKPGAQTFSGLGGSDLGCHLNPKPQPNQVSVHYTGTLANGTVFHSTRKNKEPEAVMINTAIPGWREALRMMKVAPQTLYHIP